jgi:hypothetical protein
MNNFKAKIHPMDGGGINVIGETGKTYAYTNVDDLIKEYTTYLKRDLEKCRSNGTSIELSHIEYATDEDLQKSKTFPKLLR